MSFLLFFLILISSNINAETLNKKVLVLWDNSETSTLDYTQSMTHLKLEVLLNHYGIQADYLDINQSIPKDIFKKVSSYIGIISWLSDTESQSPIEILKLIKNFYTKGKKIIILGEMPFLRKKGDQFDINTSTLNKYFNNIGLKFFDNYLDNSLTLKLEINKNFNRIEYERKIDNEISPARHVTAIGDAKVLLKLTDTSENISSDIVFHTKQLFYVSNQYALYQNNFNDVTQWRIDPYYLISWLQDFKKYPTPDTTTILGRRIFYSHIDGDAFISVSQVDRKSYCGEIILNEIIKKYNVPITASIVSAEIDESVLGTSRITKIVKDFFKQPNIEAASHTFTHPLSWMQTPNKEDIKVYSKVKSDLDPGIIVAYDLPNYTKLNFEKEIHDSITFVNNLVSEEKKTNILLWSGSCRPEVDAMNVINKYKYLNMNGGDTRFDKRYPSVSHVFPLYRKVGPYFQIYSSMSNENTYTNLWQGPYSGFSEAIETFENTNSPKRLKPINIYYHFYSGEKRSSLFSLQKLYEWSLKQQIYPIKTSEYIKVVNSFTTYTSKMIGSKYLFSNLGYLKTIRYDDLVFPDLLRSKNIIGFKHFNNSTYFHIHPDKSNAELVLQKTTPDENYIIDSNLNISDFSISKNKISFNYNAQFGHQLKLRLTSKNIRVNTVLQKSTNLYHTINVKKKSGHIELEILK